MMKNLLFDLDGTLVDTSPGILESLKSTIDVMGLRSLSDTELERFIGPPLKEIFCELYKMNQRNAEKAVVVFRDFYGKRDKLKCELYDGIVQLLQYLKEHNFQSFVATSKPTIFALEILDYLGVTGYFVDIVGSNLDNTRSKKAEVIQYILEKYKLNKNECVMIGDKAQDLIGAKESGIRGLGVAYGYGTQAELCRQDCLSIVDSPDSILKYIKDEFR